MQEFDWLTASAVGLFLVTAFLAFATFRMAAQTKRAAEQTTVAAQATTELAETGSQQLKVIQEQASYLAEQVTVQRENLEVIRQQNLHIAEQAGLQRETLQSSIQPVLVDVPRGMYPASDGPRYLNASNPYVVSVPVAQFLTHLEDLGDVVIHETPEEVVPNPYVICSVPFRNIGRGPAFVRGANMTIAGEHCPPPKISSSVVAPGELTRVTVAIPKGGNEPGLDYRGLITHANFVLEILYMNMGETTAWRTRAVGFREDVSQPPRVRQIFLFREGEQDEFASSGPADY